VAGALVLRVPLPPPTLPGLAVVLLISSFACTGLGLVTAALALRVRETAVLSNLVMGVLLIFCGVNVPLSALPGWMSGIAGYLPLTHGIAAAREVAAGTAFADVTGALATEALIGVCYLVVGMVMLRLFEVESKRNATLDLGWRARPSGRQRSTKPSAVPRGRSQRSPTLTTRPGRPVVDGCWRSSSSRCSQAVRGPSATTSTRPSSRFAAWPTSPSSSARDRTHQRKPTPCTVPRTKAFSRTVWSLPSTSPSSSPLLSRFTHPP
jgi:ABC-2 type transport system permease protein